MVALLSRWAVLLVIVVQLVTRRWKASTCNRISALKSSHHGARAVGDSTWQTVIIESLQAQAMNKYRATVCDVITHRNECKISCKIHFRMGKQDSYTNACHTRATATTLLDFLYKWIPLHLVYTIAMLVSEETRRWPYKASDKVWICHAEVKIY